MGEPTLYVSGFPEWGDRGCSSFTESINDTTMFDEKGAYLPCTVGQYHVHRPVNGDMWYAQQAKAQCNCPHLRIGWMCEEYGLLTCYDCDRTFEFMQQEQCSKCGKSSLCMHGKCSECGALEDCRDHETVGLPQVKRDPVNKTQYEFAQLKERIAILEAESARLRKELGKGFKIVEE